MALLPKDQKEAETFMREVDDAVRGDQLQSFFARFGIPVIAAVVLALGALGGWLYWNHQKVANAEENGRQFAAAVTAMEQQRPDAAAAQAEKLVTEGSPNYQLLARMIQGNAAELGNDAKIANARYGAAAAISDADPVFRDLALIRQTLVEFDTLEPAKVVERLQPVIDRNGPAFPPAAELAALAELKRGKTQQALALYRRIAESNLSSPSLKRRAQQMVANFGGAPVPETATPAAAAAAPAAAATTQSAPKSE